MNTQGYIPRYTKVRASFESPEYLAHLDLVTDAYMRKGFIDPASKSSLVDKYDRADAEYGLLYPQDEPAALSGTFRLIRGVAGLPIFSVFPRLPVAGICTKLCESTRVVSKGRGLSGRSNPAGPMLFETVMQTVGYARARELVGSVSLGSPAVFERINAAFSGCQRALTAPYPYNGGIVIPCIVWTDEFERTIKKQAPHLYSYYIGIVESWRQEL